RPRRGRGALRRLHGRRRGRDRGARRYALAVRRDPRRRRRRRVRGGLQPRCAQALAHPRPGDRQPLMPRIEDYALISDLQSAALVERGGSIAWLCFPRFDSGACFAALLGTPENGRWLLAPQGDATPERQYLEDTFVLETTWRSDEGVVRVLDFMPPRG